MTKLRLTVVLGLIGMLTLARPVPADDLLAPDYRESAQMPDFDIMLGSVFAQTLDEDQPGMRQGRYRRMAERMQQRKHLEQLRMLKMLELLNLDENQEVPFLTAFNSMRKKHRGLDEQISQTLDTLAKELRQSDPSEDRITELIERIARLDNDKQLVAHEFAKQAETMLSVVQMGRYVVFRKRFESELLQRVGQFREGRRRGSGEPPSGGKGKP